MTAEEKWENFMDVMVDSVVFGRDGLGRVCIKKLKKVNKLILNSDSFSIIE